ncbi:hypothetical protein L5515_004881 [Caenorhabditis briggsae]|uniref:Uncharacterized protein n=1 Tax=Caenorhabditis briggsae TaxID=6238 RepID=A0AAE9EN51_CAEBR|nr:hypothetical protein L5515_004881 [Caenorhabditis briggsae]
MVNKFKIKAKPKKTKSAGTEKINEEKLIPETSTSEEKENGVIGIKKEEKIKQEDKKEEELEETDSVSSENEGDDQRPCEDSKNSPDSGFSFESGEEQVAPETSTSQEQENGVIGFEKEEEKEETNSVTSENGADDQRSVKYHSHQNSERSPDSAPGSSFEVVSTQSSDSPSTVSQESDVVQEEGSGLQEVPETDDGRTDPLQKATEPDVSEERPEILHDEDGVVAPESRAETSDEEEKNDEKIREYLLWWEKKDKVSNVQESTSKPPNTNSTEEYVVEEPKEAQASSNLSNEFPRNEDSESRNCQSHISNSSENAVAPTEIQVSQNSLNEISTKKDSESQRCQGQNWIQSQQSSRAPNPFQNLYTNQSKDRNGYQPRPKVRRYVFPRLNKPPPNQAEASDTDEDDSYDDMPDMKSVEEREAEIRRAERSRLPAHDPFGGPAPRADVPRYSFGVQQQGYSGERNPSPEGSWSRGSGSDRGGNRMYQEPDRRDYERDERIQGRNNYGYSRNGSNSNLQDRGPYRDQSFNDVRNNYGYQTGPPVRDQRRDYGRSGERRDPGYQDGRKQRDRYDGSQGSYRNESPRKGYENWNQNENRRDERDSNRNYWNGSPRLPENQIGDRELVEEAFRMTGIGRQSSSQSSGSQKSEMNFQQRSQGPSQPAPSPQRRPQPSQAPAQSSQPTPIQRSEDSIRRYFGDPTPVPAPQNRIQPVVFNRNPIPPQPPRPESPKKEKQCEKKKEESREEAEARRREEIRLNEEFLRNEGQRYVEEDRLIQQSKDAMAERNRFNPRPSTSAGYSTNQGYHFEDRNYPLMNGPSTSGGPWNNPQQTFRPYPASTPSENGHYGSQQQSSVYPQNWAPNNGHPGSVPTQGYEIQGYQQNFGPDRGQQGQMPPQFYSNQGYGNQNSYAPQPAPMPPLHMPPEFQPPGSFPPERAPSRLLISHHTPREYVISEIMSFLRRNEQAGYPVYLVTFQQEMPLDPAFNVFAFIQQEMKSSVRIGYSPNPEMHQFYLRL